MLPLDHTTARLVLARHVAAAGRVGGAARLGLSRGVGAASVEIVPAVRVDGVSGYSFGAIEASEGARGRVGEGNRG